MNAVDTNVFVYALDDDELAKQAKAQSLFQHSRYSLSHWDALLLAACKDAGVTTLYTEDLDAGTDYDGLTVVNPFV